MNTRMEVAHAAANNASKSSAIDAAIGHTQPMVAIAASR